MLSFVLAAGLLAPWVPAPDVIPVEISVSSEGVAHIQAEFGVPVRRGVAWEVLTDYREATRFLTATRESRFVRRWRGGGLLRHAARFEWWYLRRTLTATLHLDEDPKERLTFSNRSGGDFAVYEGDWRLAEKDGSVVLRFRARVATKLRLPSFIARAALERHFSSQFSEMRGEMTRRASVKSAKRR